MVEFTTADLSDAHPGRVQTVQPVFRDFGGVTRFWGPIETVRVFEDNVIIRDALESKGGGRVLVVDGGGSLRSALVGGRLVALAKANGWAGLLINGCVRDAEELRQVAIGIRALATIPTRGGKAGTGEPGKRVTFAGVAFVPGHFLYADPDGVLLSEQDLLSVRNP
jgi:regulator of ribonuclease activity A